MTGVHPKRLGSIDDGPLLPVYEKAHAAGALTICTFDQFAEPAGSSLTDTNEWVVVLVEDASPQPLKALSRVTTLTGGPIPQFEGGEHTAIGDSVLLKFSADDPGTRASQVELTLANGARLTYGQILTLGGDFYGVPDAPIADGATFADRMTRFRAAYSTLAERPASVTEAEDILRIMQREIDAVNAALRAGLPASSAYGPFANTLNNAWNVVTGGGSIISDLIPMGRYLKLATKNWDHFGQYAVLAYQAGHAVALALAVAAHETADPVQARALLTTAYANNAFADHFLSDLFSAGHIRNPRKELYTTSHIGLTANLCAKGMHDEDSKSGLVVSNRAGNTWRAYGDKHYFDTANLRNKSLVDLAVQASATEVLNAFLTGTQPADPATYEGLRLAPDIARAQDYHTNSLGNFSPMFALSGASVQCRNELNDLNDQRWTSVWTTAGMATRLESPLYHPNEPTAHIAPPATAPVIDPDGWVSHHPIPPNWVSGAQVRYFVSFVSANYESAVGPGCDYWPLTTDFQPTLSGIPLGPPGVLARNVFREFVNQPIQYCGTLHDNTTTILVDTAP